jgi:4-hydroxy-3-methylbut-2-enyl diphosphate reductase
VTDQYYRRGFGLKQEIADTLVTEYHSDLVERIRETDGCMVAGPMTFRLAKEFGFCYGVDRAVEYAYETRRKFPDKKLFLVGEIIHNPHVNAKMEEMGIEVTKACADGIFDFSGVSEGDAVILPAFGVSVTDFKRLEDIGCVVVDTTCGSVLNVWKRVQQYARNGFTAVVHGKYYHEETKATVSQVSKYEGGSYIIVRDMAEANLVCEFIENGGSAAALADRFSNALSPGFDPEKHLVRVGIANQTTMLSNESLEVAVRFRDSMISRYGEVELGEHFKTFDTICSATQERQDAVIELIEDPLDAMIVIGGYNSSNTNNLATICDERVKTFHIKDSTCIDLEARTVSHKLVGKADAEIVVEPWGDDLNLIGVTAGASTPNNKIGDAIGRILAIRGIELPEEFRPTTD